MTNAERLRTLRVKAVAEGRCLECRMRDADPGLKTCRVCLDAKADRKSNNKANQLCGCGAEPRPGRATCQPCADSSARYDKKRREDAIDNGLCPRCRRSPCEPGRRSCSSCLKELAESALDLRATRIAEHRCAGCGATEIASLTMCADCIQRNRDHSTAGRARDAAGVPRRPYARRTRAAPPPDRDHPPVETPAEIAT